MRPRASSSPDAPIARQIAGAREHEIAQSRETHQRVAPAAERVGQPSRLSEPARDERSARVVAEAQPVARPGGNGQHVLYRAADLDAGDVVAFISAQRIGTQERRHAARQAPDRSPRPRPRSANRARLLPRSSVPRRRRRAPATAARGPGAQDRCRRQFGRRRDLDKAFRQPYERRAGGARARELVGEPRTVPRSAWRR